MSIGFSLLNEFLGGGISYDTLMQKAEVGAMDINQDWEEGSTTFIFKDDSAIEVCGEQLCAFSIVDEE